MATIGSLVVDMSLDSAAFIANMQKAANQVSSSASNMSKSLGGIAGAIGTLSSVFKVLAVAKLAEDFANLVGEVVTTTAEIGHLAEAVGLTTAQYQEWSIAAQQVGVDHDRFNSAIERFASNLGAAREGTGSLVTALQTLDPELLNQLRNAPTVNDALLVLTQGMGQLKGAADQARVSAAAFGKGMQELGQLSSGNLAIGKQLEIPPAAIESAKQLLSTFDLLKTAVENGFSTGLIAGFDNKLKATDIDMASVARIAGDFGVIVGAAMKVAVQEAENLVNYLPSIGSWYQSFIDTLEDFERRHPTPDYVPPEADIEVWKRYTTVITENHDASSLLGDAVAQLTADMGNLGKEQQSTQLGAAKTFQQLELEKQAFSELPAVLKATQSPLQAYQDQLAKLSILLKAGKIDQDQFALASNQAAAAIGEKWASVASSITGSLGQIFTKNKGFAIASAVLSALAGGLKTYEAYGFTPYGIAAMAAGAAMAAAQIAQIESTTLGSGSSSAKASASSTKSAGAAASAPLAAGQQQSINISLVGQTFGRGQVEGLVSQLKQYQKDGGTILLT